MARNTECNILNIAELVVYFGIEFVSFQVKTVRMPFLFHAIFLYLVGKVTQNIRIFLIHEGEFAGFFKS